MTQSRKVQFRPEQSAEVLAPGLLARPESRLLAPGLLARPESRLLASGLLARPESRLLASGLLAQPESSLVSRSGSYSLLEHISSNPFLLAPMAGITTSAFRSFMREMGCGVVVTELVSANGLLFGSKRTRELMAFSSDQHPVGVQLFGETTEALTSAAKEVEQMGADFVDLNLGCPVPKVVKKGAGSALLKDLVALRDVLRALKSSVSIPVTIKVRTGWDENSKNSHEVAQLAFDEGITWMAIHGRTRSAGYKGKADWDYIEQVKEKSPIPIIGNGDITNPALARKRLAESNCDAVMIGRGCLKNPWIFVEARGQKVERDFTGLFNKLRGYLEEAHEEKLVALQLKKLAAWYSAGYKDSSTFRRDIFATKELSELQTRISDYFGDVGNFPPKDTSHEPFLMGGHG